MNRIICVGNRLLPRDAAGPAVFDRLLGAPLPDDVEVVDGGLAGLDLLRFVEGARRVVFVDAVLGVAGAPPAIRVLDAAEAAALAPARFDHAAGLFYLLRCVGAVCQGEVPEIAVVGIEGTPDEALLERAASVAVSLASGGRADGIDLMLGGLT